MKIAVVGATGTAGRATVLAAERAGHEVVGLSRSMGVDLHTGEGLVEALAGADAVIDASNVRPTEAGADVVRSLADATTRLVDACERASVTRLVHLSICNIDDPAFDGFASYLAKRAQERVLADSRMPHAVIRSAQWMEFALNPAAVTETDAEVRVQDWLVQPVAVAAVADALVEAAVELRDRQVAGPEPVRLPDLTRRLLTARGDARPVAVVPPAIPELAGGVLLAPAEADLLGPTPAEWLAAQ